MTALLEHLKHYRRLACLALVGGAATMLYALITLVGAALVAAPVALVSVFAYGIAAALSYAGHRLFTFGQRGPHGAAPLRFAGLSLAGYGIAFALPLLISDLGGVSPIVPVLLTSVVVPALNALALSRLVFRAPLIEAGSPSPIGRGTSP
jgi:putative flippase GtrA